MYNAFADKKDHPATRHVPAGERGSVDSTVPHTTHGRIEELTSVVRLAHQVPSSASMRGGRKNRVESWGLLPCVHFGRFAARGTLAPRRCICKDSGCAVANGQLYGALATAMGAWPCDLCRQHEDPTNPQFPGGRLIFKMLSRGLGSSARIVLIMLGNGMHFTLIGLRGGIEGFRRRNWPSSPRGYFVASCREPAIYAGLDPPRGACARLRALGQLHLGRLIAFPLLAEPWAWTVLRLLLGFCMSGIYVVAESCLNSAATNETRGKVLSAYMMGRRHWHHRGAGVFWRLGDAGTSVLFIGASILVSISFAPILLSMIPAPRSNDAANVPCAIFSRARRLARSHLPAGQVYATQLGMGAVFGTQIGSTGQIALFIAMLFAGLVLQYPLAGCRIRWIGAS